jgi:hypothetical protein
MEIENGVYNVNSLNPSGPAVIDTPMVLTFRTDTDVVLIKK